MSSRVIQVGDEVRFGFGKRFVVGQVREDLVPIGVGGRHLYLVSYELGKDNPYFIELPAEDFKVVEPKLEPR